MRDIHVQLGTGDHWRLRLGVGHPGNKDEDVWHRTPKFNAPSFTAEVRPAPGRRAHSRLGHHLGVIPLCFARSIGMSFSRSLDHLRWTKPAALKRRPGHAQGEKENGDFTFLTLRPDAPAMAVNDTFDGRQANTGSRKIV